MFGRHVIGRVAIDGFAGGLAHQQQAERQGLGEGAGEEIVEVAARISRRLGMGIENVAEFLAHLLECRSRGLLLTQFGQTIPDDAADKARGMGEQASQLFGVGGGGRLGLGQSFEELEKRIGVVLLYPPIRRAITLRRIERGFRNQSGPTHLLVAPQ